MLTSIGMRTTPPAPVGQQEWTTPGTYSWTCPAGVFSVCGVCVGGGQRAGAGLGWRNDIPVVPGTTYTIIVAAGTASGAASQASIFIDSNHIGASGPTADNTAGGGPLYNASPIYGGTAGGGQGGTISNGGGGGAGGYSGNGGSGGTSGDNTSGSKDGSAGTGGAPGGGSGVLWNVAGEDTDGNPLYSGNPSSGGGGVGIHGQGASGTGGVYNISTGQASPGVGGSSGANGLNSTSPTGKTGAGGFGGAYGGGAGQFGFNDAIGASGTSSAKGGDGAVRLIWGSGRAFPSTNTGDM